MWYNDTGKYASQSHPPGGRLLRENLEVIQVCSTNSWGARKELSCVSESHGGWSRQLLGRYRG